MRLVFDAVFSSLRAFLNCIYREFVSFLALLMRFSVQGVVGRLGSMIIGRMTGLARANFAGLLVCLLILVVYVSSVPPYLLGGDHAEFVLLARSGGIAHPPGYPLYVAYLRSLSWISSNPAQATGLATALIGLAQCSVLYVLLRFNGANQYVSAAVVAFWGLSSLSVYLNTHAEVFALNNLLASLLLLVMVLVPRVRPGQALVCSGFLSGLAISNHHTSILLFPCLMYAVFLPIKRISSVQVIRVLLVALACALIGMLPYLFLFPWSSNYGVNFLSWGVISDWSSFVHHFLRRDYGTLSLSSAAGSINVGRQWTLLSDSLYWSWNILLPFAIVSAIVRLRAFRFNSENSWFWVGVWSSFGLSGPILVLRFNNDFLAVVERFHALPALILALPIADGVSVCSSLIRKWRERHALGRGVRELSWLNEGFVWGVMALFMGYFNYSISERRMSSRLSSHIHYASINGLSFVPNGAIVLVYGDHQILPYGALQIAFGLRRDVHVVAPAMLAYDWYRTRMERQLGGLIRPGSTSSMLGDIVALSERRKRHLFMSPMWSGFFPQARTYQYGIFRKYVAAGWEAPSASDQLLLNKRLFNAYKIPSRHMRDFSWSDQAVDLYDDAWVLLSEDLRREGASDLTVEALSLRGVYGFCHRLPCE